MENIRFLGIGYVTNSIDKLYTGRIKVRFMPSDNMKSDEDLSYAVPLLPQLIHIIPKTGEAVLLFTENSNQDSQRFYIGPIIGQLNSLNYAPFNGIATKALRSTSPKNGDYLFDNNLYLDNNTFGSYAKEDEVALYGRKNSDIIIGDDDIRIRCNVRQNGNFNKKNPSFLKLRYYPNGIEVKKQETLSNSTATLVAEEINLISPNGDNYYNVATSGESIDDKTMQKIVQEAHVLPYGDVLVDFLQMFYKVFQGHVHPYSGMPPIVDDATAILNEKYPQNDLPKILLSKHIRIN